MNRDKKKIYQAVDYLAAIRDGNPHSDTAKVLSNNPYMGTLLALVTARTNIVEIAHEVESAEAAIMFSMQLQETLHELSHLANALMAAGVSGATDMRVEGKVDRAAFECEHFDNGEGGHDKDGHEPEDGGNEDMPEDVDDALQQLMDELPQWMKDMVGNLFDTLAESSDDAPITDEAVDLTTYRTKKHSRD